MDSEQTGLSTKLFLGVVRRRAPLILLCCVLVAGAAYGYSKHKPKKYTATAALIFNNDPLDQQIAGLPPTSSSSLLAQQASNRELVSLGDMATKTATILGHGLTAEAVTKSLTIGAQVETNTVDVSSTSTSPTLAAAIANTYVLQVVKDQLNARHQFFQSALALVNKQLAGLSQTQRFGTDGVDLEERAHTLGLLADLGLNDVQVAQEAAVPSGPSSPKTKRNTILGAILGLLLGFGIALLLERLDRRIREPDDLEAIYRLPLLGVVPRSAAFSRAADRKSKGIGLPTAEAEAFNLIRAHLRFFNVDREVRTVVIASPAQGDGKTTVARHLAEAAARLGSRVLLLEGDLRRPTVAQQLDIEVGPGLADVLIGAVSIGEAIQSVDLQEPSAAPGGAPHTLDVLPAGALLPPNPGELLESHSMGGLLEQVKSTYDLVVIDTPPLTAVSDAFPLLTKVDGVILVGSIGRSRRDAAEGLHRVLEGSGLPLLGVIANNSRTGGPSPYPGDSKVSPAVASPTEASSQAYTHTT
jgi:succinoglycan biosynthesis transport protein ExoP